MADSPRGHLRAADDAHLGLSVAGQRAVLVDGRVATTWTVLAALAVAGLCGIEALVLHNATGRAPTSALFLRTRGWSPEQWAAARDRLRERGLLDEVGDLTESGAVLRGEAEVLTDRLAAAPYDHLGPADTARLTALAGGFTRTLRAAGAFPTVYFGKG